MTRPPKGPGLVDSLDGDDETKERLRAVLETIAGEATVTEACAQLGISPARFHALRKEALASALQGLAPKTRGRPPKQGPTPDQERIAELEGEVERLQTELDMSRMREELAVAMPGRFGAKKNAESEPKPTSRAARRRVERARRKAEKRR